MMQKLWKKAAIAAMICGALTFMPSASEAAMATPPDYPTVSLPGQMPAYELSVNLDELPLVDTLSPAERRRIQRERWRRERWERERHRREMERRRRYHRPPPPPPRRHRPPRRHWSADTGTPNMIFQFPPVTNTLTE